tara:strand:+ start:401 stop:1402 length:1002 start_codon:yes stop_codon:yes gene_type:complete
MSIKSKYLPQYQKWRILDHFFGNNIPSNRFEDKRNKVILKLKNEYVKKNIKSKIKKVDRVKDISNNDLKHNYIKKGIPVVIEEKAKQWEAIKKWSPEWLLKNFYNDKTSLFNASINNKSKIDYKVKEYTLKDVLEGMKSGDKSMYSRFNRILYDHPQLIEDFDWKWLYEMRNYFSSGKTFQVFIGGKGTNTSLHAASENNLFTQIYGKKHWYLYPPENDIIFTPPITRSPYFHTLFDPEKPDYSLFPNAKHIVTWECELNAGDILYNPPSWWHHVTNKTNSIGVGFRWFNLRNSLKMSFTQTLLTIMATNPPIWYATKNRTDFAKIFKYMNKK